MNEPPASRDRAYEVRHVGDQVALIVAESVKEAKDAIELIEVDYDVLPASSIPPLQPIRSAASPR